MQVISSSTTIVATSRSNKPGYLCKQVRMPRTTTKNQRNALTGVALRLRPRQIVRWWSCTRHQTRLPKPLLPWLPTSPREYSTCCCLHRVRWEELPEQQQPPLLHGSTHNNFILLTMCWSWLYSRVSNEHGCTEAMQMEEGIQNNNVNSYAI